MSPRRSGPRGLFGWVRVLAMLGLWGWMAYAFTRWVFPFATGVRLLILLLVTPVTAALAFHLVYVAWRQARAWLLGTAPPPWPGSRELAVFGVAAAVAIGLGVGPTVRLRRQLATPRRLETTDSLGYRVSLETRLGWWGVPYRFTVTCPGPRACRPLYSFGFFLRDPATGEHLDGELWPAPSTLAQPGGRWTREKTLVSVKPTEYRRARPVLRFIPLPAEEGAPAAAPPPDG